MTKVLGIHVGHDSGAALVEDGRVVAAVDEERLSRLKHCADFPLGAIRWCLEQAGGRVDLQWYEGMSQAFLSEEPTHPQSLAAIEKIIEFVHREVPA